MLRLFDIVDKTTTEVSFTTEQITSVDSLVYTMYDTSTGYTTLEDYYCWRTPTLTSTGLTGTRFNINTTNLFPKYKYKTIVTDYTQLDDSLFTHMSWSEYLIFKAAMDRVDLVRKRLPQPSTFITDIDGVGQGNIVSAAGGYAKKFSVSEMMRFIEGALIEVNITSPKTEYYWNFTNKNVEVQNNPYYIQAQSGVPYKFIDVIIQGTVIRAMWSWGLLEVDLNFSTSDAGLQVTYDKANYVSSWMDKFITQYEAQKKQVKWDCVNSAGVGVGTIPYAATGLWGYAMNMIQHSGIIPLQSMLGYGTRGNTPM